MPNILIVDDSVVDRKLVGALLPNDADWNLRFAGHGKEALEQFSSIVPDLVLTDLQMPEMNGLELVSAVKADYPFVPVILMTAHGSEEIAAEALRVGAASYVPKRRITEHLLETVHRVLAASEQNRSQVRIMHYLERDEATFSLSNDLALIGSIVEHAEQLLRCLPLGDEVERLRVGIALEEALKNAYYHGSLEVTTAFENVPREAFDQVAQQRLRLSLYAQRRIHVTVSVSRCEARFVVRDQGPGFDVLGTRNRPLFADKDCGDGRGIVLMRSIMDEVNYNEPGNEVTMIKRPATEIPEDDSVNDTSIV